MIEFHVITKEKLTLRKIFSMRSCLFIDNSVKSVNTSAMPSPFLFSRQTQSQVPMGPSSIPAHHLLTLSFTPSFS